MKRIDGQLFRATALCFVVCLQATFLVPYAVLVPGERTNVFTALLVLLPLLQVAWKRLRTERSAAFPWRAIAPWLVLAAGLGLSASLSPAPFPAALRALSFIAPAVGGLACGHGLFRSEKARRYLFHMLTVCFAGLAISHLIFGVAPSFLGLHHHALAGALVLLSAGPIHMAGEGGHLRRALALALLVAGAVVCFVAGSRFVVLLPFVLIPVYLAFRSISLRSALLVLLCSAIVAGGFFVIYPTKVLRVENYESTYYRVEAFPATWAIVKQHPLLGVGIRTPRQQFLESYEPVSGMATKAEFFGTLERNVTWDNQYLSLLCGIGVPLSLLYFFLAGRLLAGYLRRAWRQEIDFPAERALTFALLASVIHFTVHDGLFYPQISWFFHLLLGVGAFYLPAGAAQRAGAARPALVPESDDARATGTLRCVSN
ncbi:MAG: O-antigen ligase family protein [Humidesulfovibrio sp.]|nr:O-antigen ligase family protein [Humidesulfovibrio sp.]